MRFIITLIVCFLSFTNGFAQQCAINLSSRDCVSCVANMNVLMKSFPDAKIVLNIDEIEDSTDIIEKFGLTKYGGKITWAENSASAEAYPISWVTITDSSEVIFKDTLKTMDFINLANMLEGRSGETCKTKLPNVGKILVSGKHVFFENTAYRKYYLYNPALDSLKEFRLSKQHTDDLFDRLNLNAADKAHYYSLFEREPTFKPKFIAASYAHDTLTAVAQVLLLDEVRGKDSIYDKQYAIIHDVNYKSNIAGFIDLKSLPKLYYFEESLVCWKGRYFIGLKMSSDSLLKNSQQGDTLYKIAEIRLQDGAFRFHQLMPFKLEDYLAEYNIYYNMTNIQSNNGLISHVFSNTIYNLNNGESVTIPYEPHVTASIANFMTDFVSKFYLSDFIWDSDADLYTILYMRDGSYFISNFKPGDTKFRSSIQFLTRDEFLEKNYAIKLQQNGQALFLLTKPQRCLINYYLNGSKAGSN